MEEYRDFSINTRIEKLGASSIATFICRNNKESGGFAIQCCISDFKKTVHNLNNKEAEDALREAGYQKVRELINLQQFEYDQTVDIGEIEFDRKTSSWRC